MTLPSTFDAAKAHVDPVNPTISLRLREALQRAGTIPADVVTAEVGR